MLPIKPKKEGTESEAEIFSLIQNAEGSDGYYCLHSVGLARHQRKEYAEADFVVVGPPGVFCIEVKGGEVHRIDGVWHIGWPGKSYTSFEGPFKQAQNGRWPLAREIKDRIGLDIRKKAILGWGVVFPHIIFTKTDPEWDPAVIYDQRDKPNSFIDYVLRLEGYFKSRLQETGVNQPTGLSLRQVEDIVDCLRGDFDLVTSIKGLISDSNRELIALSREQYMVLDLALSNDNPRILCEGSPGTGKTLIGMEAARRLVNDNKRVLFLCFNSNLKSYIDREIGDTSGIKVSTIFGFLGEVINLGGYRQQLLEARQYHNEMELYGDVYPKLFEDAVIDLMEKEELPQYDVVIVDEGQDMMS